MIKISWSILNAWKSGRKQDALDMVMGKPTPDNEYMKKGREIHKAVSSQKLRLLDLIDDSYIFEDMEPAEGKWQNYFKIKLSDTVLFSMVVDCLSIDGRIVIDWKSGKQTSSSADPMQLFCYAYALGFKGIEIDRGIVAKVNDDLTLGGYSVYIIDADKKAQAAQLIAETASEIMKEL